MAIFDPFLDGFEARIRVQRVFFVMVLGSGGGPSRAVDAGYEVCDFEGHRGGEIRREGKWNDGSCCMSGEGEEDEGKSEGETWRA